MTMTTQRTVWLACARHVDESDLDVTVLGSSKEAASRALLKAVDGVLVDVSPEDIELNRTMYRFEEPYELNVHD